MFCLCCFPFLLLKRLPFFFSCILSLGGTCGAQSVVGAVFLGAQGVVGAVFLVELVGLKAW